MEQELMINPSSKKKIGFFSAILIVIGSTIGVGIFLRSKSVLSNSAGNIAWSLIVWAIAGFAVVAMALALVEVASGRNDNLGMIGWTKAFNTLYIYKATKFFMTYLYLPFTFFFMPYYVIVQFQDGVSGFGGNPSLGNESTAPWVYMGIGIAMVIWFIFTSGISGRAGNIQNLIITSVKFIPLVAVVIVGIAFTVVRVKSGETLWKPVTAQSLFNSTSTSFLGLTPFLGVFASLGGIFFAFDGFYVSAGMQSEMKNPEKTPAALVIGLLSITTIYIIIAAAMTLGGEDGGFYSYGDALADKGHGWAFGVLNIMIAVGVLGVLNGFTIWATRWVEDLIKEGEMFVPGSVYRYVKHSKTPIVGALFCLIISLPLILIFTPVGAYGYIDYSEYGNGYGGKIGELLSFSDLMANWMAVFAFAFIAAAIYGAIRNRKLNFIAVEKNKHTIWAGWTSVTMIGVTMFFMMVDPFISVGLSLAQKSHDAIVANVSTSLLFIVYVVIMFAATPIEKLIAQMNKAKIDRVLSGNICAHEKVDWCPCKLANLREFKELNDLVLATFEKQVR